MFKKINWRYAIGEVIIVIIGISIAFNLNQWANNKEAQKRKVQYLENLNLDLESEVAHFNENISTFNEKMEVIKEIRPYLYGQKETKDISIPTKVFRLAEIVNFAPNDITYHTLINSGDFSLIDNFGLQKALQEHYSNHNLIRLDYLRQEKITEKYLGPFMINDLDYTKMYTKKDFSFLRERKLHNIVQSLFGTYQLAISSSQKGIEQAEKIKAVIEAELK